MLFHVAGRPGAVVGEAARREPTEVGAEDVRGARRRPLEPGEHPEQRRLPRPAWAENDEHLPFLHGEGQALQGGGVSLGRRIDAEEVADLDGAHTVLRVGRPTSAAVRTA